MNRDTTTTFASVRSWDEATFSYVELMLYARGPAGRELIDLHDPPMVIVRWVRHDSEPAVRPQPHHQTATRPIPISVSAAETIIASRQPTLLDAGATVTSSSERPGG